MKAAALMAALLLATAPGYAQLPICTPHIEGSCDETPPDSNGTISSFSQAQYYSATCGPDAVYMQGDHHIDDEYSKSISQLLWGVQSGYYSGTRGGSATPGNCYTAYNDNVNAYPAGYPPSDSTPPISGGPWISNCQCMDGACDKTCSFPCQNGVCPPQSSGNGNPSVGSPILFDLDGNGFHLGSDEDPVSFDLQDDGIPSRWTWTRAGQGDAFLCRDINHNGTIDSGAELFDNYTRLMNGQRALNGYEALKELDSNGDGIIDAGDKAWPELLVWIDSNHDGISQREELLSLDAAGVVRIEISYIRDNREDSFGNIFRFKSKAWIRDANEGVRPIMTYDVFFRRIP